MLSMSGVYQIRNTVNGKRYVGSAVELRKRRLDEGWSVEDTLTKQSAKAFIEHNGESKSLKQWAEDHGMKSGTLARRLKSGWDMEKALNEPLRGW